MAITLPLLIFDVNGLFHKAKALFHDGFMQGLSIYIYVYRETKIHGAFAISTCSSINQFTSSIDKVFKNLSLLLSLLYCSLRKKSFKNITDIVRCINMGESFQDYS